MLDIRPCLTVARISRLAEGSLGKLICLAVGWSGWTVLMPEHHPAAWFRERQRVTCLKDTLIGAPAGVPD